MQIREILEKKHTITLLLTVYANPGIMQKELADKRESGSTAKLERITEMICAGLITEKTDWRTIRYFITEEGERISRLLQEIESGEDEDAVNPANLR